MPSVVHRVRSRDALTEEEYIICTPVVLGFCLRTKKWGGFAISRLLDLEWNPQAFKIWCWKKEPRNWSTL